MKKPSVSQLLDLLAKPALINWANRQGLAGIDIQKQRQEAMAGGTSLHKQVENVCKDIGTFENPLHFEYFTEFMKNKMIVSVETKIETEWFVGRYDCKLQFQNTDFIVDYKSGYSGNLYLENKLQLVAYQMAEPASRLAIVSIPDFTLIPVVLKDKAKYEEMLVCLSKLYTLKWEIEHK